MVLLCSQEEIEKYSSQFTGYAQQDSQELLTVLLDGIHEDLNLMKTTPYFDTTINANGRTDEVLTPRGLLLSNA